jgi:hypothetical protein
LASYITVPEKGRPGIGSEVRAHMFSLGITVESALGLR